MSKMDERRNPPLPLCQAPGDAESESRWTDAGNRRRFAFAAKSAQPITNDHMPQGRHPARKFFGMAHGVVVTIEKGGLDPMILSQEAPAGLSSLSSEAWTGVRAMLSRDRPANFTTLASGTILWAR